MSSVADGLSAIGARIETLGISKLRAQPGFKHQNLLSLHDICPREKKTGNALIAHALSITVRITHMLHFTHGFYHPWIVAFHLWKVGFSMDGRHPQWYPTIHLIAANLPPTGLPSMDGISYPWTATLSIDGNPIRR